MKLGGGKYHFYLRHGTLHCDRYGAAWRTFLGDKAIHLLFEEAMRAHRWVPVTEGLPDSDRPVAVLVEGLDDNACIANFARGMWFVQAAGEPMSAITVTHWADCVPPIMPPTKGSA